MDTAPRHAALSGLAERSVWRHRCDQRRPLAFALAGGIGVLARLIGDGRVDLKLTSAAAGVTRHYEFAVDIQQDAVDARVFSGIHFRTADEVSIVIGNQVANWALDHHFAPAN